MSEEPSTKLSSGDKAAIAMGGIAGGAGFSALAYHLVPQHSPQLLVQTTMDPQAPQALIHTTSEIVAEAAGSVPSNELKAFREIPAYKQALSSESGVLALDYPDLFIHEIHFPEIEGKTVAEIKLSRHGLMGITKENAADTGLVNAKFNAKGKAIEGSYIIHHLPKNELVGVIDMGHGVCSIPSSQISKNCKGPEWEKWVEETASLNENAKLAIDKEYLNYCGKIADSKMVETEIAAEIKAPVKKMLKHMDTNSKLMVGAAALVGVVVGALAVKDLLKKPKASFSNRVQDVPEPASLQGRV